jgi:hypothetical protein
LPTFLVIGAPKAGTTSLYAYLAEHPEVFMSPVKEPRFLAQGDPQFANSSWAQPAAAKSLAEYEGLFATAGRAKAVGEASTVYLRSIVAPRRAADLVPDAKLIALLRDPVDRAYSAWGHLRREGLEPIEDFEEAVRREPERAAGRGFRNLMRYTETGRYATQLERWRAHFPASAFLVGLTDDLRSDPAWFMERCHAHIGVTPSSEAHTHVRHNKSGRVRIRSLHRVVGGDVPEAVRKAVRSVTPAGLRRRVAQRIATWNLQPFPRLDEGTYERLAPLFRDELLGLREILGRDLHEWKTVRVLDLG